MIDIQLPQTANHLPPGGSKPRHGQKKGLNVKVRNKTAQTPAEGPLIHLSKRASNRLECDSNRHAKFTVSPVTASFPKRDII